jgi:hypothetical protein
LLQRVAESGKKGGQSFPKQAQAAIGKGFCLSIQKAIASRRCASRWMNWFFSFQPSSQEILFPPQAML